MFPLYSITMFELVDFMFAGVINANTIFKQRRLPQYNRYRVIKNDGRQSVPEQSTVVEFKISHVKRFYELFEKAVPVPLEPSERLFTRVFREAFAYTLTLNHVIQCADTDALSDVTCPKLMDTNAGFGR